MSRGLDGHPASGGWKLSSRSLPFEVRVGSFADIRRIQADVGSTPENGIGTVVMSAKGQRRFGPNIRIAHAVPLVQPTCKKFRLGPIA